MAGNLVISQINGGPIGVINAIINGNFQVNQRGVSGTVTLAAGAYGHDRWKAGASGCTYTFATSNNVTTLTISAGSLIQVIEGINLYSGTYALSWSGTAQGKIGAGSYSGSGVTGSVTGGTDLNIEFGTGTLSLVQFEPGTEVSPFERRDYGRELMMCQRYYYKIFPQDTNSFLCAGYVNSSTTALLSGFYPVTMRIAPTALEQSGTASNYRIVSPVNSANCSSVPTFSSPTNQYGFVVNFTVASGLTTGYGATGRTGDTTGASGYLAWSAEL